MGRVRVTPRLYDEASKIEGNYHRVPWKLMDAVCQVIGFRNGADMKLLLVLLGTKGDGTFYLGNECIRERTGLSKAQYYATRRRLMAAGYMKKRGRDYVVDVDAILAAAEQKAKHQVEVRKETKKREENAGEYVSENMKSIFESISVDVLSSTMAQLNEIIGEEVDEEVLRELVTQNMRAWRKKESMSQGYKFGILKNLVAAHYQTVKADLAARGPRKKAI